MDWQPIETAPRDGTVFMAYRRDAGILNIHYVSPADLNVGSDDYECRWWTTDGQDLTSDMPTHWMPLPLPPITTTPQDS